ncbi:hypothetical protein [Arthrobacter rhombi]|uniref:Secreted protein n=1 Tax=Arthrobacter rhombi TaxID=71253 RepID=A0A1R4GQW4_9MICC|nr:hypothetical protein [Arthrobacter rhombi]SJM70576.1 hypothetical protein FM101_12570 [Arthrobacter rhombi]
MINISQTTRRRDDATASSVPVRRSAGPRLLAVAAVGLLSLTACSNANGAGEASTSSSPGGASGSSEAPASASQDTGAIDPGAADEAWKEQARKAGAKDSEVDATRCVDELLDQKTLDAVATALPDVGGMYLSGLYTHAGCTFTASNLDDDPHQASAMVQIRRYYLSNDEEYKTLNESGFLKHGQCADDVKKDENGVSTINKHGVKESNLPGASAAVELQAAWHCSEDDSTTSAVLIHAAEGQEDGFSDPTVLTEPDLATEMATHLYEAEADWAPQMDAAYEKHFKDNMGQ